MNAKLRRIAIMITALMALSLVLVACGGDPAPAPEPEAEPATEEQAEDEAMDEDMEDEAMDEDMEDEAMDEDMDDEAMDEDMDDEAMDEEAHSDDAMDEDMDDEAMDEEMMEAVEIRFAYYGDGAEPEVMQGIVDAFMADNEDISVILDIVPYQTIDQQLPIQVETGEGPDLARITNFGAFRGALLDMAPMMADADYFAANFPAPILAAMRTDGDDSGLHGFPDGFTVTGPYVNLTLFEQAGIDVPGPEAGWSEWAEATAAVAEATTVPYALSIDRTGHRFAGPALSMGATLIDADGNFVVQDEGFKAMAEELNSWHEAGITPSEVWLVGDSVNSCIDFFKSGELVMCMSGSWQINGVAADVGDVFDWAVVPNPMGPGGSTGVAGGSAVVAFADTEHPEAVTRLMEYLASAEAYSAFSAGTLILPAQTEVATNGVDYATDDEAVLAALAAYTAEIPKLTDAAVQLNVHPFAFAYYRNSANRIGQYLAGELSVDDALAGLAEDIDDAIAEAMSVSMDEEEAEEAEEAEVAEEAEEAMEEEMMMDLEGEIRFAYYGDGAEPAVMQELIDTFLADYPNANIILDVVPYQTIDQQLPVQVETGEGPDLARITNFGAFRGALLDMAPMMADADYFAANFPAPILAAMRTDGDDSGLHGFPDGFTVTGPYVNLTLFEQAGIDVPGPEAGWSEWAEATAAVAEATTVPYALSIDRTGHRFAGPALSMGATLIDADGNFVVQDEGFKAMAEELNSWHEAGITPSEVWLVGDSVNSCIDFFKSGELVMCMSGSWQINGVAADVADDFDWAVVPNPAGPGGSTGVAGGSAVVAFADTEHPELVTAFMEYLASVEAYSTFSGGTLILPAQTEVASNGVDYATEDEAILAALAAFTAEIPKLTDAAVHLNVHPYAFAYYRNSANRIGQYLAGELSVEEALAGLAQDIEDAIAEAEAGS